MPTGPINKNGLELLNARVMSLFRLVTWSECFFTQYDPQVKYMPIIGIPLNF